MKLAKLESVLRGYLVLPTSPAVCKAWAEIRTERRGQPIAVDDAWIAATAVVHGAALVTHNPVDFRGISRLTIITHQP